MHLAAYMAAIDSATLTPITALNDDVLTRPTTQRFLVPKEISFVHWIAALGVDITRAALVSPSIGTRRMSFEIVPRVRGSVTFEEPNIVVCRPLKPFKLDPTEHMEMQMAEDGVGATEVWGLVELGPETLPAIPPGDIREMRLTGTTTLVAETWTTVQPTEDVTLEPGNYALIGFLPISANVLAARVLIPGQTWRPGMPGLAAAESSAVDINDAIVRSLMGYDMGHFDHNNIPQFQFLSNVADTSETIICYIVKL